MNDCICRRQERGRGSRLLQPRGHGVAPDASASSSSKQFGRSAPFPTQRSFGLPRQHQSAQAMRILEEQAAAKALQWRKRLCISVFYCCHILDVVFSSFEMASDFAILIMKELFFSEAL